MTTYEQSKRLGEALERTDRTMSQELPKTSWRAPQTPAEVSLDRAMVLERHLREKGLKIVWLPGRKP